MSNTVTNAEVEDVLSSVRRLVSSDPRQVDRGSIDKTVPADATEQSGADRLVLTPALRVAAVQDGEGAVDGDQPDGETSADSEQEHTDITEQTGLVLDVADGLDTDESDGQNNTAELTVDEVIDPEETIEVNEADSAFYGSSNEIDPAELRFLFRARKRTAPHAEPSENDAAVAEDSTDIEPEALAVETAELAEVDKPAPLLLTDPEPSSPAHDVGEEGVENGEQTVDGEIPEPAIAQTSDSRADAVPPEELTAKIAALETVIAQTADQWDPDDDGVDEYAGTSVDSLAWEDHIDLDGSGAPFGKDQTANDVHEVEALVVVPDQTTAEDQTWPGFENEVDEIVAAAEFVHQDAVIADLAEETIDDPLGFSDDESADTSLAIDTSMLDEAALREVISEIVRQELNGSLGERITHNVRKLVRRELQRALAAEELQ